MTAGLSQLCPIIIPDPAGLDQSDHHRPIASEDWSELFKAAAFGPEDLEGASIVRCRALVSRCLELFYQ
jgi:hypothetical protein